MPQRPITRVLSLFGISLASFFLARLALLLLYRDDFRALGLGEVLWAFIYGLRFDASVTILALALPMLMLLLPFGWARGRVWQGLWTWAAYVLVLGLVLLQLADLAYFSFVHRHIGPEIAALGNDMDLLIDMGLHNYYWLLLIYVGLAGGLFLLWRRLYSAPLLTSGQHPLLRALGLFGVFVAMVVLMRGGFTGKPVGVVDAFVGNSASSGYLVLNGPYSTWQSMMNSKPVRTAFMPWPEAVANTQKLMVAPGEKLVDGQQYPLLRARNGGGHGHRPNVVVMMLESWDAVHIDALRRGMGLPALGLTPNFDALSRDGVLFTNFYAAGERSMDGLAALLAGVPTLPGSNYIGRGMEQSRMGFLGRMADEEGYQTIMLQSAKHKSFYVDSIAALAGFKTYKGAEEIPVTGHTPLSTERGVWDYDMLHEANRLFADAKRPFLGFLFTASTHGPYQSPGAQWQPLPGDNLEQQYMNSLYYADWALGKFMDAAKAAGYYRDTIFILTGDHVSGFGARGDDFASLHHIPLLVIAPGLKPGINARVGGQLDVIPTVADLAGWQARYASLGRSVFDASDDGKRGVFSVRGNTVGWITGQGWVTHNLKRRVDARTLTPGADADAMEHRLLSVYQVIQTLLYQNRIYPGS